MLSDPRIVAYYAYIVRYWTDYYNSASTNLEQYFANFVITELERLEGLEDTESNRLLFTAENNAQANYVDILAKYSADLATEAEKTSALSSFSQAKELRQSIIPNTSILLSILRNETSNYLSRVREAYNKEASSNNERLVITAKKIQDDVEVFAETLGVWVSTNNAQEKINEYAGKTTTAIQDAMTSSGYFSDGNYGSEINRVSPEGFVYGANTFIQKLERYYWWNGYTWLEIPEAIDQANSVQLLPTSEQEPYTVFRVINSTNNDGTYNWRYFFWNPEIEGWSEIFWYYDISGGFRSLPAVGFKLGEGHKVIEPNVLVMWDGENWVKLKLSTFDDDLGVVSTLDMYGGTLQGLSPEIQLVYISPTELSLRPVDNDFEYTVVNDTVIDTSKRTSVFSFSPVLDWWEETESFSTSLLQHSTAVYNQEYFVYLANKKDCFNLSTYDFRGRLFCSSTAPTNNRLGKFGTDAYNGLLIGKCQTAVPGNVSDKVTFLRELDVSSVSRAVDMRETFREFSDFDLVFVDQDTIELDRIYGTTGQIFIAGQLYYIGEGVSLTTEDTRIIVDGNGAFTFDYDPIAINTVYYVYVASDSDLFNDNSINPATNRPWHPEDDNAGDGSTGNYRYVKDLRLRLFLSTKTPEEGRLAETWRGYWARHVGQVRIDGVGKFVFSSGISSIRQATLNPTYFDGLAEVTFEHISDSEFRIIKTRGTSGICMVGGKGVQTYVTTDPLVHKVSREDIVYTYTEANYLSPLSVSGTYLRQYTLTPVYIYLANNNACWGTLAGRTFACTRTPSDAYLSPNYPGNNARWLCTIDMDGAGNFTGSYISEGINSGGTTIDDATVSRNTVWSSYRAQNIINDSIVATNYTWSSSQIAAYLSVPDHV